MPTRAHVLYPVSACGWIASTLTFEFLALDKLLPTYTSEYWSFSHFASFSTLVCALDVGMRHCSARVMERTRLRVAYELGARIPIFHMAS